jgi:hypothetical protein
VITPITRNVSSRDDSKSAGSDLCRGMGSPVSLHSAGGEGENAYDLSNPSGNSGASERQSTGDGTHTVSATTMGMEFTRKNSVDGNPVVYHLKHHEQGSREPTDE